QPGCPGRTKPVRRPQPGQAAPRSRLPARVLASLLTPLSSTPARALLFHSQEGSGRTERFFVRDRRRRSPFPPFDLLRKRDSKRAKTRGESAATGSAVFVHRKGARAEDFWGVRRLSPTRSSRPVATTVASRAAEIENSSWGPT